MWHSKSAFFVNNMKHSKSLYDICVCLKTIKTWKPLKPDIFKPQTLKSESLQNYFLPVHRLLDPFHLFLKERFCQNNRTEARLKSEQGQGRATVSDAVPTSRYFNFNKLYLLTIWTLNHFVMESGFERKQKHFKVNSPIPNLAITGTLQAKLTFRFKSQA